jgi:hypothetical protein
VACARYLVTPFNEETGTLFGYYCKAAPLTYRMPNDYESYVGRNIKDRGLTDDQILELLNNGFGLCPFKYPV